MRLSSHFVGAYTIGLAAAVGQLPSDCTSNVLSFNSANAVTLGSCTELGYRCNDKIVQINSTEEAIPANCAHYLYNITVDENIKGPLRIPGMAEVSSITINGTSSSGSSNGFASISPSNITSLDLPDLENVTSNFKISDAHSLSSLNVPKLNNVTGLLEIDLSFGPAINFSFPSLSYARAIMLVGKIDAIDLSSLSETLGLEVHTTGKLDCEAFADNMSKAVDTHGQAVVCGKTISQVTTTSPAPTTTGGSVRFGSTMAPPSLRDLFTEGSGLATDTRSSGATLESTNAVQDGDRMKPASMSGTASGLNAAVKEVVTDLASKLSPKARIVTEQGEEWNALHERWSDLAKQTPAAIVAVATEADVQETVKLCVANGVKFVPKAGGHSLWSTIGAGGIVIDLTALNAVTVDKEAGTVTVSGGSQIKDAVAPLYAAGLCAPFGTANTVGAVPQAVNGGLTVFSGLLGQTSDAILSARLVTSTGDLVTASATSDPDLLYAIKGAGTYFGLITSLTLRASPLSVLNSSDGTLWKATAPFPASRTGELISALAPLAASPDPRASGAMVITKSPHGDGSTVVLASLIFFGSSEDANAHFASIKALGPFMWGEKRVPYSNVNDDFDPFCVNGGFKKHVIAGVPRVPGDPEVWEAEVKAYETLIEKVGAQAARTMVCLMWVGKGEAGRWAESAFGHRGVLGWIEAVSWYTDEGSTEAVRDWQVEALRIVTSKFEVGEVETFQNSSRDTPIESRFPGEGRLEKLTALKKQWDPQGVFTDVLL
ncbi:hypothetical protein V494_08470 [Pseudogymnoascus sp. VKM F-4513 (FW-928)]|nr:hypothetical protein V494_08470 [Pseudogymnoascus sp. VKM F-4513 (FW-928)]